MGGVDLLDRVIGKYPMRGRTKKWTVRTIHHFFDFAIAAGWLEYRNAAMQNKWPKKEILSYYSYKLDIAENLIFSNSEEVVLSSDEDISGPIVKRPRVTTPMPPKAKRTESAMHLPQMMDKEQKCRSKCRAAGCKSLTFVRCRYCKVFLCFTSNRDCFYKFHNSNV